MHGNARGGWRSQCLRDGGTAAALGVCYLAATLFACTLGSLPSGIKPVWWPTGVAFAGVVLLGYRVLPAVAAAELLAAHWLLGLHWAVSAVLAAAVTVEVALGVWLLRRLGGGARLFASTGDVLRFVAVGLLVAPGVGSSLAAGGLVLTGVADPAQWVGTWGALWVGDAAGVLIIAPLAMVLGSFHGLHVPKRLVEGVVVVGIAALLTGMLVGWVDGVRRAGMRVDLVYALFPVMFWASLRLGQPGAASITAVVAGALVTATGQGEGPFAGGPDLPSLLRLDSFLLLFGLTGLIPAAAEAERRTAERGRQEAFERLAYTDALTGLANHAAFRQRFAGALERARRSGQRLAVLFIDLNDFKRVNDAVGHEAGNEVLKVLSERFKEALPTAEVLARVGGDEFATVLGPGDLTETPAAVTEGLCEALARPVLLNGRRLRVTPSVGLSFHPDHGSDSEELLWKADMAMYSTKRWPGTRAAVYAETLGDRAARRATLSEGLRSIRSFEEFHLCYQPLVDLADGRVVGAEALLQWQHPSHGRIPPAEFVPLLEQSELIGGVGEWLIHEACKQAQACRELIAGEFSIAVNISPTQLYVGNLQEAVVRALRATELPPHALTLELTETALVDDDSGSDLLTALAERGVRLAVDDFGTGYSALRYLSRFPLQMLKIDRTFVASMLEDSTSAALIRTIVDIGRVLGMRVVAEGVETPAQAGSLREVGCHLAQGYCFSRPLAADELTGLLRRGPAFAAAERSHATGRADDADGLHGSEDTGRK